MNWFNICPFCSSTRLTVTHQHKGGARIACQDCDAMGPYKPSFDSTAAREAWNKRWMVTPVPFTPPGNGRCFVCGGDHGGMQCPNLTPMCVS